VHINMFKFSRYYTRPPLVIAVVLAVAAIATAQTTLQGQLGTRPITRSDISVYKLPSTTALSGGLSTVGIGAAVHLEAQVSDAVAESEIGGVVWTLTSKPTGSAAVLEASPLSDEVPIYDPADRAASRLAGRKLLRPDVAGQYTVTAAITTTSAGTVTLTTTVTAGTYVGVKSCVTCHSGGNEKMNKSAAWSATAHASIFKEGVNGTNSDHYGSSCIVCHTVGYDATAGAVNGGFDDIAAQVKWSFPTAMKEGNWDAVPEALKNVSNIQCENCHGPGSQHATTGSKSTISVTSNAGACAQCHDAMAHHYRSGEWNNSMHAVATRDAAGAGHEGCVGCHTGNGFVGKVKGAATTNTEYSAIGCQTCHEPHGQTAPGENAHLVRNLQAVTLKDGTVVAKAGNGAICMNCHQSRQNAAVYATTTAGSARFGPHHSPQADMLAGANGFTYNKSIPSSAHGDVVKDTCVGCHMQAVPETDPALTKMGGHTFKVSWAGGADGVRQELVGSCQQCHGEDATTFNFALLDYDGDGEIEGVQTEVGHLLDQLSALLPPNGTVKTALTIDATWTQPQLQGAYNWQFVKNDGSMGVHNMAYAVGLLKASIADLGGGPTVKK
jgi:hypothetical protein